MAVRSEEVRGLRRWTKNVEKRKGLKQTSPQVLSRHREERDQLDDDDLVKRQSQKISLDNKIILSKLNILTLWPSG